MRALYLALSLFLSPPLSLSLSSLARSLSGRVCARAQERVSRKRDSVVVGQSPTCGGDGTSDNKTLPEYPRDPHAMQGAACCVRVLCLDAAGQKTVDLVHIRRNKLVEMVPNTRYFITLY